MIGIYQFLLSVHFPVLDGIVMFSVTFQINWHLTVYTFPFLLSIVWFEFYHVVTQ